MKKYILLSAACMFLQTVSAHNINNKLSSWDDRSVFVANHSGLDITLVQYHTGKSITINDGYKMNISELCGDNTSHSLADPYLCNIGEVKFSSGFQGDTFKISITDYGWGKVEWTYCTDHGGCKQYFSADNIPNVLLEITSTDTTRAIFSPT